MGRKMTQGFPDTGFLAFAATEKREQLKTATPQDATKLSTEIRGLERLIQQQESDHVQSINNRIESQVA